MCIYGIVIRVIMVRVPYGTHRWNTYLVDLFEKEPLVMDR